MIPKTVNLTRINENLGSTKIKLDPEDMKRLREIEKAFRLLKVLYPSYTHKQFSMCVMYNL